MVDILISSIIQVALFSTVPFVWWFITARKKESFFAWIGLKKPIIKGSLHKLSLISIASISIYGFLMFMVMEHLLAGVVTGTSQFEGQGIGALPGILIYACIQTGLSEEILFRGFIGKRLIEQFGFTVGNTVQALLFGLLHGLPFGLVTGNVVVTILLTLLPGSMGWIQGWLNEKCASGSIVPSWIMHGLMNIVAALFTAL